MRYPPNPLQQLNRVYTGSYSNMNVGTLPDAMGFNAPPNFRTGFHVALANQGGNPITFQFQNCAICHDLPMGTNGGITEPKVGVNAEQVGVTAQWRAFWTKMSSPTYLSGSSETTSGKHFLADASRIRASTGFGFLHDGRISTPEHFLQRFTQNALGDPDDFLTELDVGSAPATVFSEYLTMDTRAELISSGRLLYLTRQADAGNCDLAVRGHLYNFSTNTYDPVGFVWDRGLDENGDPRGYFIRDNSPPPDPEFDYSSVQRADGAPVHYPMSDDYPGVITMDLAMMLSWASSGYGEFLFLGVPLGSGERFGVDKDRDGVFDQFEIDNGLDPEDEVSGPVSNIWDLYAHLGFPFITPQVFNVKVHYVTTNTVKLTWDTNIYSPSIVEFGKVSDGNFASRAGDPFDAGSFHLVGNQWKRRHMAFMRLLDSGTPYQFRIATLTQFATYQAHTGTEQQVSTSADTAGGTLEEDNIRIDDISLSKIATTATSHEWGATVTVLDQNGVPAVGVSVSARFTEIVDDEPFGQGLALDPADGDAVAVTDASGVAEFEFETSLEQSVGDPGDRTMFTVPELLDVDGNGTFEVPVVDPASRNFLWAESVATCVEVGV